MFSPSEKKSWWRPFVSRCWQASIICLFMISPVLSGQGGAYIPSLNATVEGLFFYESGKGFPHQKDRVYRTEFGQSQTRYVNWEIRLKYPKPGRRIDFAVHHKYFDPQGKMLAEYDNNSYIESNWTSSNHAGGYTAGTWTAGNYRVELYVAGNKVASGTFEVVSDKGVYPPPEEPANRVYPPPEKPDKKGNIPDDLGEL